MEQQTIVVEKTSNPLLEKIRLPGENARLPSGGLFYTPDIIATEGGEVHVFPLNTYEELLLKNPDLLLNGTAIETVFSRCIPDIKQPKRLLSKDVDYLIMFLRRITYGNSVDVKYQHTCKDAKVHTYNINLQSLIQRAVVIDSTNMNQYKVTMPNGQVVELKPVEFGDMVKTMLVSAGLAEESSVDQADQVLRSIVHVIKSVDGVTDPECILEWLRKISPLWSKQIVDAVDALSDWGPNTKVTQKCLDCGEDVEIDMPINPLVFFI